MVDTALTGLEQRRSELYAQLAAVGDLRRGSVNKTYRRCGKANCVCAEEGHRGHGPRYLWTRSVQGRTQSRQLAGPEVDKVRREVANYREFTALSEELVAVNEAICEARGVSQLAVGGAAPAGSEGEKGGSSRR